MKEKSKIIKTISLFLAILIVFDIIQLNAFAKNNLFTLDNLMDNSINNEEYVVSDKDMQGADDDIVCEISNKRDETTKHYLRSDGSFAAVAYSMPIHYQKAGEDEWLEIDNTLVETTKENGETYLSPVSSPIDVEFAEIADSENMIEYNVGGNSISWSYENGDFGLLKKM